MKKVLLCDENATLYIENEIPHMLDGVFLHLDVNNWSHNLVKKYRRILTMVVAELNSNGINNIYCLPPSPFEEKLVRMFGFKGTGITFSGYKLMKYGG